MAGPGGAFVRGDLMADGNGGGAASSGRRDVR
jgi:hypothetical protein